MKVNNKFLEDVQNYCQGAILGYADLTKAKEEVEQLLVGRSNHYEFLYEVVKRLQPKTILELGTHLGVATLYMAKASPNTKIYTIDNNFAKVPDIAKYAKGLLNVEFILGDVLDNNIVNKIPNNLDIIFADTEKDPDFLTKQLNLYYTKLKEGGFMFFDDIVSNVHYVQGKKWWNELEGYNQMDLPLIHKDYEMGVIIR